MKKGIVLFALPLTISLVSAAVTADAATYGRAEIWIPARERPVEFYKGVFAEEVMPEFLAELKKQNPGIDEKELAEKVAVRADLQRESLLVYVQADHAETGVAEAHRLAQTALRKFIAMDQAERMKLIQRKMEEQDELKAAIEPLQEEVRLLGKDPRLQNTEEQLESLRSRLSSCREELEQAELKNTELQAKRELLSEKAAQTRDTVSIEEVAFLQKTARELAMQLDDAARLQYERKLKRHTILLEQKEKRLADLKPLLEGGRLSAGEFREAQDELELAKYDYELAKMELDQVKQRLNEVKTELQKAKRTLAETGGLELASIIAEKTLQCETEMAGVKVKIADLRDKIEAAEKEMKEIASLTARYRSRSGELSDLQRQVHELQKEETAVEGRLASAGESRERLQDTYRVESVQDIEAQQGELGTYDVMGEVKNPGQQNLQAKTSLLDAIKAAGGFTDNGDPSRVIVIHSTGSRMRRPPRPGPRSVPAPASRPRALPSRPQREVMDCSAILEGKSPDDFMIEDGDVVVVPRRAPGEAEVVGEVSEAEKSGKIFVGGGVRKPGKYAFAPETTVLKAIEMAGGFTQWARKSQVRVLRRKEGAREEHRVNCSAILKGEAVDDFVLEPGDVVVVPEPSEL